MKKFFTLIAVAVMAFAAQAETLTVYDGNEYLAAVPFNGSWVDEVGNKTQVLFPAADLTDMVGKTITAITFYTEPEGSKLDGGLLDISLGETELNVMSNSYITEGMTKVGSCSFTAHEGEVVEMTIVFDTPYTYNGGNLVFENVVVEATTYQFTYWTGVKTNYDCAVVGSYGGASTRQFLPKTTFTYEGGESGETTVDFLAEANTLEDNSEFTFNGDAVVTVCRNGYVFLRDESGFGMISGVEDTFENGQVLSQGWSATKTSVDGWVKYTDAAGLSASGETNAELAAALVPDSVDESLLNAYICIKNQKPSFFPARNFVLPNGSKITKTESLWAGDADATTGNYNVYGVVCKVNGTLMFNIISYEDYVEPAGLRGDVNLDQDVNIADVTTLIDYLLMGNEEGISLENANCNLDADVNIADVTTLIDFLLMGNWPN